MHQCLSDKQLPPTVCTVCTVYICLCQSYSLKPKVVRCYNSPLGLHSQKLLMGTASFIAKQSWDMNESLSAQQRYLLEGVEWGRVPRTLMIIIWLLQQPEDDIQMGTCAGLQRLFMSRCWSCCCLLKLEPNHGGHLRSTRSLRCSHWEKFHYVSLGKWTYKI